MSEDIPVDAERWARDLMKKVERRTRRFRFESLAFFIITVLGYGYVVTGCTKSCSPGAWLVLIAYPAALVWMAFGYFRRGRNRQGQ
jgi:hypothetical protein